VEGEARRDTLSFGYLSLFGVNVRGSDGVGIPSIFSYTNQMTRMYCKDRSIQSFD